MEGIKYNTQCQEVFISSSKSALIAMLAAEYFTEYYCILVKGLPHIYFSALTVVWIKLTSVCLVLSIKRHSAHKREMGGE